MGSFAFATAAGKNEVHNLRHIYEVGKKDMNRDEGGDVVESRRRRRLTRRTAVAKNLETGHGLSDSHGGHWVKETSKDSQQY